MKRERTWRVGEMSLALAVSLGLGSWAWGQCSNDAGSGDLAEGEACLVDEDEDTTNRGCYSDPPAFFTLTTGDFTGGVVDICGSGSNYRRSAACDVDAQCLDGNCQGDPNPGDGVAEGTCVGPSEPSWYYVDTDWYLIPQSVLMDHDADGNGVLRITSEFLNAELDANIYLVRITDPDGVCDYWDFGDIGCWDTATPANSNPASEFLILADYPDGMVVFAAPGTCDGSAVWEGYECSTGNNDYILRIAFDEAPTACQPGPPQGPCNEANASSPGCEDPACCEMVCLYPGMAFCCVVEWSQTCVEVALDLGCAAEPGPPGHIATGDDPFVDGYLRVKPDSYGAWASPDYGGTEGGSDLFNPPGANLDAQMVTFTSGFFFFIRKANQRELLANNPDWQTDPDLGDYHADTSLDREITSVSVPSDTDGDGVDDRLVSQFRVWGTGVDLTFDLTQQVEPRQGVHGAAATLIQTYAITNNLTTPVEFAFQRNHDADLLWTGANYDDAVGTGFHGHTADLYVFVQEVGGLGGGTMPGAAFNLSSPSAAAYVGAKGGAEPDSGDPDCPAYGYGTDSQHWDHYGMPDCWRNHIAHVGHDVNGSSGDWWNMHGDVHTALELDITVPAGPNPMVTVEIMYTYGQQEPWGQENSPCPWDCIATGDDPEFDGYLRVKVDSLGSFGMPDISEPFEGDLYNPATPSLEAKTAVAISGLYVFLPDAQQREFLTTSPIMMNFYSDDSLLREITSFNVPSDTDGNGVDDQMVSQFQLTGSGVDLTFDLTQHVRQMGPGAVSTLTQDYVITNNLAASIDFMIERHYASWMRWLGDNENDSVGTYTNGSPHLDRFVFSHDPTYLLETAVTVSSPSGMGYMGAKQGVQAGPGCEPYGYGASPEHWEYFGILDCWRNSIANVGYNLDGISTNNPGGDAHTTLEVPVSLDAGPGESTTVTFTTTYGQAYPPEPCPWDCQATPNGNVDIPDFLALLAQWGQVSVSCDFDGGGVSVTDFLEYLAHFGPCP